MFNAFTSGRDFICKVGETLPGLNSAVCKVRRMVYRYTLNTDAGEELVTKDIEDDADVAAIVLGRCVVYVDVSVDPSSPAVAAEMKVKAARTDPALHDRVFDQRGSYTAHQMAEELQSDLRRRLTIPGCAPPVSLYGIVVKPAMIKCVCPRETVIDYKDPTDSHQYLLHAVKCPVLRKVVPSQLQKAFTVTVDAEKKHNLHKNESQKERARERADKVSSSFFWRSRGPWRNPRGCLILRAHRLCGLEKLVFPGQHKILLYNCCIFACRWRSLSMLHKCCTSDFRGTPEREAESSERPRV